jgi:hypothetical protein
MVMCSLSYATEMLERSGYSLLQVRAGVVNLFGLLMRLRRFSQLAFNDATYVLNQYRHLFPCVPATDAAWQVVSTRDSTCFLLRPTVDMTQLSFSFGAPCFCHLGSDSPRRYRLAVSHRTDASSEAICAHSAFKCMSPRIKHMQVRPSSSLRKNPTSRAKHHQHCFGLQNLARAGSLTDLHAHAYR